MSAASPGASPSPVRLLVIVRSMDPGGAERQLLETLRRFDRSRFVIRVICFYRGSWHGLLESIPGVEACVAGKTGRFDVFGFFRRLYRLAREFRPGVVYGYMFVADLLALAIGRRLGARVVWGLRSSALPAGHYGKVSNLFQSLSRRFARRADLIISNSQTGLRDFMARGARVRKSVVIPNGIDTERFAPNRQARERVRASWGVAPGERVIGLVARIDPMKGHRTFLEAASELAGRDRSVRFVCIGSSNDRFAGYASELRQMAGSLERGGRLAWLGHVDDVHDLYPALDVCTSASHYGEGFSNSIGEAMACGVACVVSNVGDSAEVIGDPAWVVPPGHAGQLLASWERALANSETLGARNRARAVAAFSAQRCALATQAALLATAAAEKQA